MYIFCLPRLLYCRRILYCWVSRKALMTIMGLKKKQTEETVSLTLDGLCLQVTRWWVSSDFILEWHWRNNLTLLAVSLSWNMEHDSKYTIRASLVAQWSRICLPSRRCRFNPWVRKIPWRRDQQPTPLCLSGEIHGQRSLAGYSSWGLKSQTGVGN